MCLQLTPLVFLPRCVLQCGNLILKFVFYFVHGFCLVPLVFSLFGGLKSFAIPVFGPGFYIERHPLADSFVLTASSVCPKLLLLLKKKKKKKQLPEQKPKSFPDKKEFAVKPIFGFMSQVY